MDWICWVVPVKPGQTDLARKYCEALETTRRADYEASERQLGIAREVFFLWHGPDGDYIVLYMDGDDMTKALALWEDHTGEFESWGKAQWAEFCDPAEYPKPLSAGPGNGPVLEVMSAYDETIHKTGSVDPLPPIVRL
jgi:Family of unknown function (DUF6176)